MFVDDVDVCVLWTWPEHCILCPFRDDGISSTFQENAGGRHIDASISLGRHAAQGAGIGGLGHAIIAVKVDDGVRAGEIWQDRVSEYMSLPRKKSTCRSPLSLKSC